MRSPEKAARPVLSVVTLRLPASVPLPVATAAVTSTPACGTELPEASRNCTTGCTAKACPEIAEDEGWVSSASWDAVPAPRRMTSDVTLGSDGAENRSVYSPGGPVIARSGNAAAPAVVTLASVPVSTPVPDASSTVMVRSVVRGLPRPSNCWTTGPTASGTPLSALGDGCRVSPR